MGIRFRKRVKLFPGVTINLSKTGISTTVGVRGASVNFGKKGTYVNTGIPGTGIYSRKKIGGGSSLTKTPSYSSSDNSSSKSSNLIVFLMIMFIIGVVLAIAGSALNPIVWVIFGLIVIVGLILLLAKSSDKADENVIVDSGVPSPTTTTYNTFDPLFEEAARLIFHYQQCSVSLIQRKLSIGYNRAGKIMDQLVLTGIIIQKDTGLLPEISVQSEVELEAKLKNIREAFTM